MKNEIDLLNKDLNDPARHVLRRMKNAFDAKRGVKLSFNDLEHLSITLESVWSLTQDELRELNKIQ